MYSYNLAISQLNEVSQQRSEPNIAKIPICYFGKKINIFLNNLNSINLASQKKTNNNVLAFLGN